MTNFSLTFKGPNLTLFARTEPFSISSTPIPDQLYRSSCSQQRPSGFASGCRRSPAAHSSRWLGHLTALHQEAFPRGASC